MQSLSRFARTIHASAEELIENIILIGGGN